MDDLVKSQYWTTKVSLSSTEQNEPVLVALSNEEKGEDISNATSLLIGEPDSPLEQQTTGF